MESRQFVLLLLGLAFPGGEETREFSQDRVGSVMSIKKLMSLPPILAVNLFLRANSSLAWSIF